MNNFLTCFLFLLSFIKVSNAQFLWYENETNTNQIEFKNTTAGTFFTDVTNPNNIRINTILKYQNTLKQTASTQTEQLLNL